MDTERVVITLKRVQVRDITPGVSVGTEEEQKEIEEKKSVRSRFDFQTYQIPVGAEIYFSRDELVKAKVLPNNVIELDGEETSLSKSSKELLGYKKPVAGTLYWMFENETLDERRRRMDGEEIK